MQDPKSHTEIWKSDLPSRSETIDEIIRIEYMNELKDRAQGWTHNTAGKDSLW